MRPHPAIQSWTLVSPPSLADLYRIQLPDPCLLADGVGVERKQFARLLSRQEIIGILGWLRLRWEHEVGDGEGNQNF